MDRFKSFAALAAHIRAEEQRAHNADVEAARRLRKASSLPQPKVGPKVAR